MELKKVESSHINAIGYEDDDLIIEYLGGAKYKYTKVPSNIYEELMKAESKGKYINSNVKNKFLFEKLGD